MSKQATIPANGHPSLFERAFRVHIQKAHQNTVVNNDQPVLCQKMEIRVDSRDQEEILQVLVPRSDLEKHGIESTDEWIQATAEKLKNKIAFDAKWKDHQLEIRGGGQNLARFANVELTAWGFEFEHFTLKFHVLAYGADPVQVGKVAAILGGNVELMFKRADHWSLQAELGDDPEPAGDADKQSDLDVVNQQLKQNIERSKDKANQANTQKARARRKAAADPKTPPKKKAPAPKQPSK